MGWGGGGVGWDVKRSCELGEAVDATHTRGGVGGMGWDVNVHVNLQKQFMLRRVHVHTDADADDDDDDDDDHDDDDPNETCQFRDQNSSRNRQVLPT